MANCSICGAPTVSYQPISFDKLFDLCTGCAAVKPDATGLLLAELQAIRSELKETNDLLSNALVSAGLLLVNPPR